MKLNIRKIISHALIWAALISLHSIYFPKLVRPAGPPPFRMEEFRQNPVEEEMPPPSAPPFTVVVILYLSLVSFYYLNSLVLIPKLLSRQKRWEYAFSVFGCVLVFIALTIIPFLIINPGVPINRGMLISSILLISLVFIASGIGQIIDLWFLSEKRSKEIEYEKRLNELSLLKAQINPHFLFNTLNTIYSLASKKSDQTPEAVLKLSEMMRYVMSEAKQDLVPIEMEIEYINRFVDLQKMRLTDKVTVVYNVIGNPQGRSIAPLILIPFIENAFKYGVSTHEDSTITITISIEEHKIKLVTTNRIFNYSNILTESTGIGITNTKKRLNLLYPGRHKLMIDDANANFVVQLELI
ncbi:MAG: sensor histidine kinase [Bacteroidetes bacterium]|nr:sensor histidine kinase [Bacteroidota bacterium]MBL0140075.1 sensor histidine kinase [Bacteroidota bacterium]